MKKLIKAYRVFTPDMYTLCAFLGGSAVLIGLGAFMNFVTIPAITLVVVSCLLASLDILCDYFVFQGIFSKEFEFGILSNSHKGLDVLRMGIRGDQLRRLIQIMIVEFGTGLILKRAMFEAGYFVGTGNYFGFILALCLAVYIGDTFVLNATRKYNNYSEGLLVISLFTALQSGLIFGLTMVFLRKEVHVDAFPWVLVLAIMAAVVTYCMCERVNLRFKDSFGERKPGRYGDDSKRKMIVFFAIAFGVDFAMLPLMKYGFDRGIDLSVFLIAQMMYPMCGVALAKLFSYNEGKLPKAAYVTALVLTCICMILCAMEITLPQTFEMNGTEVPYYYLVSNYFVIIINIIFFVMVFACGKEKRTNAGLGFSNPALSIALVLLHIVLYFTYFLIAVAAFYLLGISDGEFDLMKDFVKVIFSEKTLGLWVGVILNLIFSCVLFLGEEYGWRYYLQPIMQKKFGVTLGTILLGILWGIWHAGADFMYYSKETGPQMMVVQIIACVSMGIFFAYAYMKTNNIWVPVLMHFFNNNLVNVTSGGNMLNAMQNKVVGWNMIPVYLIGYVVMWGFIFTPTILGNARKVKEAENVQ